MIVTKPLARTPGCDILAVSPMTSNQRTEESRGLKSGNINFPTRAARWLMFPYILATGLSICPEAVSVCVDAG